jgi:hypothetical protein
MRLIGKVVCGNKKIFVHRVGKRLPAAKRLLTAVKIVQDIEFPTSAFGNSLLFKRKYAKMG